MDHRRKITALVIVLAVLNGLVTLLLLETHYLAGSSFRPEQGGGFAAPGLATVAICLAASTVLVSILVCLTIRKKLPPPAVNSAPVADSESTPDQSVRKLPVPGPSCPLLDAEGIAILGPGRAAVAQRDQDLADQLAATGRLAAGLAHEINKPLGDVLEALARLRSEGGDAVLLEACGEGLGKIRDTVRRLLDCSRKRPECGPVVVMTPLMQAVDLVGHLFGQGRIRLVINEPVDNGSPDFLRVMADPGDLQHVFLNLLLNAIDAMPDGGTLTVNVYQSLKWVLVEIEDTGVGLTVDEVSQSFNYFHTTKPSGTGLGLGLSIARHIVVGYRGAVTLTSQKGVGTKATVELPALSSRRTTVVRGGTRHFTNSGGKKV